VCYISQLLGTSIIDIFLQFFQGFLPFLDSPTKSVATICYWGQGFVDLFFLQATFPVNWVFGSVVVHVCCRFELLLSPCYLAFFLYQVFTHACAHSILVTCWMTPFIAFSLL
jgi:hypothetical protein